MYIRHLDKTTQDSFVLRKDNKDFDSLYGIGDTEYKTTQYVLYKRTNQQDGKANFVQKINPFAKDGFSPYFDDIERDGDGKIVGSLIPQTEKIDDKFTERGLSKSEGLIADRPDIADYEFASYGKIQKRSKDLEGKRTTTTNDFREDSSKGNQERAAKSNYTEKNQGTRVFMPNRGKVNAKRVDWTNLNKSGQDNPDRWDTIMGSEIGTAPINDLVHLFFYTSNDEGSSDILQFRGTANGITETFSPNYNTEKPNEVEATKFICTVHSNELLHLTLKHMPGLVLK